MIETPATVVEVEGGVTWVRTSRRTACGSCATREGECGTSLLARLFGGKPVLFRALNEIGARAGDEVVIGVAESALLKSSAAAYLLPLLLLLAGAIAGSQLAPAGSADGHAVLGAAIGLVAGFFGLRRFSSRVGDGRGYTPVILRRVESRQAVRFSRSDR